MGLKLAASLERINKLGRPAGNKIRPAIVRFFDFNDEVNVMKHAKRLKGKSISISDDYSKRLQSIRKCLWDSASDSRSSGSKVRLVYDKLFINDDPNTWDPVNNERVNLRSRSNQQYVTSPVEVFRQSKK